MSELRRTPLFEVQKEAGGRMVPFAGWEMPVSFSGILEEHRSVRGAAGIFDVSHMGRYRLEGPRAGEILDWLFTGRASDLEDGHWLYSLMLNERGCPLDDLLVGRQGERFLIVVNASNRARDWDWIERRAKEVGDAELFDDSERIALIALQGPDSRKLLQKATRIELEGLNYYWMRNASWRGEELLVSRTGYTGELGYELGVPAELAPDLWTELVKAGALPCGLGARDTLRLEVGYPLYGHELDEEHTPLEAGLGWTVNLEKPDFCGRAVLAEQKENGLARRLRGIRTTGRDIPRQGFGLSHAGKPVASLVSGGIAPSLGYGIGTAYLPIELAGFGTALELDIRGRKAGAEVVKMPFYLDGTTKA